MKKISMIILVTILLTVCGSTVNAREITRELSRDGNYKLMEKDLYKDGQVAGKATFELPVEWDNGGSSVMGLVNNDYSFKLKFDLWDVISTTRESVMNENNERNGEFIGHIIEEKNYKTENYEIFYCKYVSLYNGAIIRNYFLYKNGQRFAVSGYIWEEDLPEYDDIFNRIAESIKFQFNEGEADISPATGDTILIYIILLLISVILPKKGSEKDKKNHRTGICYYYERRYGSCGCC